MIKLLLLDVDGTLTNGDITIDSNGVESKSFSVKDGLGIAAWLKLGKEVAIISGRTSKIVELRAKELGITRIFMGVGNKASIAKNIIAGLNLTKQEVACIGDDLNDLGMFSESGLTFAPNDANEYIKNKADIVVNAGGGKGAVRAMIDFIVNKNEELKKEFLGMYE